MNLWEYWLQLFILAVFFLPGQNSFCKDVPLNEAKHIGLSFINHKMAAGATCDSLALQDGFNNNGLGDVSSDLGENLFVFGIYPGPGFIIVSADDRVEPILAYSLRTSIQSDNLPPDMRDWLQSYSDQIESVVVQDLPASPEALISWENLRNGTPGRAFKSGVIVSPMIQTTWNQGAYYNEQCPYDEGTGRNTLTGCLATAMAQLMKYWNHPFQGQGSHSYTHSTYGELSANFGETTYDWASMPSSLSGSNDAVAKLMYHCGVSVDMNYSPYGSGAYTSKLLTALPSYFKYDSNIYFVSRSSYTNQEWVDLLLDELVAGRPVFYTGRQSTSGHAFICDGYDGSLFHFNWGWGGYSDGYFSIDNLNPGTKTYNESHQILYNIQPDGSIEQPVLSIQPLSRSVDANPGSTSFAVSNSGTGTMNWTAAITGGDSWIDISSATSGTNSGTIEVDYEANDGGTRTATIRVTSTGAAGSPVDITIVQEEAPGKPDLYINVTNVITESIEPGDIVRLDIEEGNSGTEPAAPGLIKYIISRNTTVSQDDIVLDEDSPNDSWEEGYNHSYELNTLRIPQSIDPGAWYLIIVLDSNNEIEEENEDNNLAYGSFEVSEPGKPDAYISSLYVEPDALEPMGHMAGHFELGNAGESEMPASHFRYAISDDGTFSGDDYTIEYGELSKLDPGSEEPDGSTGDIQLPESIGEGNWYLIVMLDCDSEVEEENENNNIAVAEFSVAFPDLPDISITNLSVAPEVVEPEAYLTGHFEISNAGEADMPASHFWYAISNDDVISGDDHTISYGVLNAMDAGSEDPGGSTGDFQLPGSIGIGEWFLLVALDCDGEVEEENEANNTAVCSFTISRPDLFISIKSINTPSITPGNYISIEIEQGNQGGIPANPGLVKYCLSRDNAFSGDDLVLKEEQVDETWDPGFSQSYDFDELMIPENTEPGDWYFIINLDTDDDLTELNEDNNIASAQILVIEEDKPDVYITGLSVSPQVVLPMANLEGNFQMGNAGDAEMPQSHYRYVISDDAVLSSEDYKISEGQLSSMGIGFEDPSGSTGDFQLPEQIGLGDWYLIVSLDCDNEVDEENEGNNTAIAEFTVAQPDLYISFGEVYTTSIIPGESFKLEIEKGNQGGIASLPGLIQYFLSRDSYISGDDILLEEGRPGDSWEAGFKRTYVFDDLVIPESTEPGEWYFIMRLDADQEIGETNEDNNTRAAQFTVLDKPKPDIYISGLSITPEVIRPLNNIEGHFEFGNTGDAEAQVSHYRYAISKDAFYSSDDYTLSYGVLTEMGTDYFDGTASTGSYQLPASIDTGDWFLLVILDCDNEVEEESESNNMAAVGFSVMLPDLYADFKSISTVSILPGEFFEADIELGNRGGIQSKPGSLRYYLSRDEEVSSDDIVLMESNPEVSWEPGFTTQYALGDFRIPEDTEDGNWFILACIDSRDDIQEEDESNNQTAAGIIVNPTQPVLALSEETIVVDYQQGTASFQIRNSGNGTLNWELKIGEDAYWLEIQNDQLSGSGETKVDLSFSGNTECDIRSASIIIESNAVNGSSREVTVIQEKDPENVADLAITYINKEIGDGVVMVEVSVDNNGVCQSSGTRLEYILCSEPAIENAIKWLGSIDVDPLQNGETVKIARGITLDGIEDGGYYIIVRVDPDENVVELDKENNVTFFEIIINTTGIDRIKLESALKVYPNPASNWVQITVSADQGAEGLLTVYDQAGKVVDRFVISDLLNWDRRIDTRFWNSGLYSVVLISGEELVYRKLIVR